MSLAAKLTFGASVAFAVGIVYSVHHGQTVDRQVGVAWAIIKVTVLYMTHRGFTLFHSLFLPRFSQSLCMDN